MSADAAYCAGEVGRNGDWFQWVGIHGMYCSKQVH